MSAKEQNAPLTMEATARTYRYLDPAEVEQVRKTADDAAKAAAQTPKPANQPANAAKPATPANSAATKPAAQNPAKKTKWKNSCEVAWRWWKKSAAPRRGLLCESARESLGFLMPFPTSPAAVPIWPGRWQKRCLQKIWIYWQKSR